MTEVRRRGISKALVVGLIACLLFVVAFARFASDKPDGLERVASVTGLDANEKDHAFERGPLSDYSVDGVEDEGLSVGLAGAVGALVAFATTTGLFVVIARRRRRSS